MQNRLLYNWQPQRQVSNFLPQTAAGVVWGMKRLMYTKLNFGFIYLYIEKKKNFEKKK